jgi:iron complex outermembrane receptor protein
MSAAWAGNCQQPLSRHPAFSRYRLSACALAVLLVAQPAQAAGANEARSKQLEHIVVTGESPAQPLTVIADPKAARQPLPAHDGADYLKTIAGFSVTRKGGADGDALFRGMAGSRLGILVDGENILGGCNSRMDAPTAYIYPELHDQLTVIKGPQSVRYGAGHSAATILFERKAPDFTEAGYRLHSSLLGASFGRHDELLDATLGNQQGYLRFGGSNSQADNYRDGNDIKLHSNYQRYSGQLAAGWTPTSDSRVELSVARSDGEAAYADRGMDGTRFLRDSINLSAEQQNLTPWLTELKFRWFDNDVDHLMDDQQLRKPGMMGYANLRRATSGGSLSATMLLRQTAFGAIELTSGFDQQQNQHDSRSAPVSGHYSHWADDALIKQWGLFSELKLPLSQQHTLYSGLRSDVFSAIDQRQRIGGMIMSKPNPTANQRREQTLTSGFGRLEHQLSNTPVVLYAGVGQTERFPDYWELIAKEAQSSASAFHIKAETTRQLDAGALYRNDWQHWSASLFYSDIDDYLLVDYSNKMKMNGFMRNVDARSRGVEFSWQGKLTPHFSTDLALSYLHADNKTDNKPLPQQAPLELRLAGSYATDAYSFGVLWRLVGAQHRYDINRGTIVGKDLGPAAGFGILSVNTGWQLSDALLLSAGIDNLLDKSYAEFVSRAAGNGMGGAIPGFVQTLRVNEPGRTAWLKLTYSMAGAF